MVLTERSLVNSRPIYIMRYMYVSLCPCNQIELLYVEGLAAIENRMNNSCVFLN